MGFTVEFRLYSSVHKITCFSPFSLPPPSSHRIWSPIFGRYLMNYNTSSLIRCFQAPIRREPDDIVDVVWKLPPRDPRSSWASGTDFLSPCPFKYQKNFSFLYIRTWSVESERGDRLHLLLNLSPFHAPRAQAPSGTCLLVMLPLLIFIIFLNYSCVNVPLTPFLTFCSSTLPPFASETSLVLPLPITIRSAHFAIFRWFTYNYWYYLY